MVCLSFKAPFRGRYGERLAAADQTSVKRPRASGEDPNWIVVDIVRMENGALAEHWDVVQDEASREESKSGLPMFGDSFGA